MSHSSTVRRRATRACDQCRKTKSRCDNTGQSDEPCRNCFVSATDCTYLQPCHKRGPPKGYLSALEQRLHDAEGLLGVIISSNDSRAVTLVSDLSKDPLAKSIITCVANSNFGPIGRQSALNGCTKSTSRRHFSCLREEPTTDQDAPLLDSNGHLVFTAPSNTWQDYLNMRVSLEAKSRTQVSPKQGPTGATAVTNPPPLTLLSSCGVSNTPVPEGLLPSSDTNSSTIDVDSYTSPISSGHMALCRKNSDVSEIEDTSSLSSTIGLDMNSSKIDYMKQSMDGSITHSFSLCSQNFFGMQVLDNRPLSANRTPVQDAAQSGWVAPPPEGCASMPSDVDRAAVQLDFVN